MFLIQIRKEKQKGGILKGRKRGDGGKGGGDSVKGKGGEVWKRGNLVKIFIFAFFPHFLILAGLRGRTLREGGR